MSFELMTEEDLILEAVEKFATDKVLPSGSGFDFAWDIDVLPDNGGTLVCKTSYEGIDGESGMYNSSFPIVVIVPMRNPDDFEMKFPDEDKSACLEILDKEYREDPVEFLSILEQDVQNAAETFDSDAERYGFLADAADKLGF